MVYSYSHTMSLTELSFRAERLTCSALTSSYPPKLHLKSKLISTKDYADMRILNFASECPRENEKVLETILACKVYFTFPYVLIIKMLTFLPGTGGRMRSGCAVFW